MVSITAAVLLLAAFELLEEGALVSDPLQYNAFPSICRAANGDLLVVYRNAPVRPRRTHLDPLSRSLLVRSRDRGRTFEVEHPVAVFTAGGMQDPSLARLRDGRILANVFRWTVVPPGSGPAGLPAGLLRDDANGWAGFIDGLYLAESRDHGYSWSAPRKLATPGFEHSATSEPVVELRDGRLLLPFYARRPGRSRSDAACLVSRDGGKTWGESFVMASDPADRIDFQEPSVVELRGGRLLCVMRTAGADGYLYQTWSDDGGRRWAPFRSTGIWGHPPSLLQLGDGRVLLSYGYRRAPFQVRACVSRDRGATWDLEHEVVLRRAGAPDADIGYPSALELEDGSILTVYYFQDAGTRFIGFSRYRL